MRAAQLVFAIGSLPALLWCQPDPPDSRKPPVQTVPPSEQPKHILGILPNYRSSSVLTHYQPITAAEKFKLAAQDSFDWGSFVLAGALAGESDLTRANPSFERGIPAYGRYFATAYADVVIGNFMTEAVFPVWLHQDPRYFQRGTGSGWSRLGYSIQQTFWTHTDRGGTQFNYSEVLGNAASAAISQAYYPDTRDAKDAITKLSVQIGIDLASNVAKEFWPDIAHKFFIKRPPPDPPDQP